MRINNDSVSPQRDNLIQNKSKITNSIVIDTLITSRWGQKYSTGCSINDSIIEAYNYYISLTK